MAGTTTSAGASFNLRPLFKLYIQTTTSAVSGGTKVVVYAYAKRTSPENRTPNSSIATKDFSMPGALVTSTAGASGAQIPEQNWTYNWTNGDPQDVWTYTRYYPYSAGATASMTLTAADGTGGLIGTATASHSFSLEPVPSTTYTATYNGNNATGGSTASTSYTNPPSTSGTVANNGFTRSGYDFNGWNTAANGTGTAYSQGGTFTGDITLYAQWSVSYVPTPAPSTPTSLTVTDATNARLILNWTGSTGTVSGYKVYRDSVEVATALSTARSYTFTGLAANTEYTLGVAAYGPDYSSSTATIKGTTLPNTFTVPNVVGQSQSTATNTLTTAGFGTVTPTLVTSGATSSNNLLVISQTPASGTTATSGAAATINVYNYLVAVPNIIGLTDSQASSSLISAGFTTKTSSLITAGATPTNNLKVAASTPTAGTQYNVASNVAYTLYNFLTTIPNVLGQNQDTAVASLIALGFTNITVLLTETGVTPENAGTVKSQTPVNSATTYNPQSQAVSLVVYSLGITGKRYNGTGFSALSTAKRFNGTAWVNLTVQKRYNGTAWVDIAN